MAFEKTAQGFQTFLASKQAGAHPLAQHLNFKSALKEARIAMHAKALEGERNRALKKSEGALDRASAETIAGTKKIPQASLPEQVLEALKTLQPQVTSGEVTKDQARSQLVTAFPGFASNIDKEIFGQELSLQQQIAQILTGKVSIPKAPAPGGSKKRSPKVAKRIRDQRKKGLSDEEIAAQMREAGLDPTIYGLE